MGSQWALEQAKYNLVNEYMLVGVTEELEDFVMMLEAALPRFFKGATELYKTGGVPTKRLKTISLHVVASLANLMNYLKTHSHCSAKQCVSVCVCVAWLHISSMNCSREN